MSPLGTTAISNSPLSTWTWYAHHTWTGRRCRISSSKTGMWSSPISKIFHLLREETELTMWNILHNYDQLNWVHVISVFECNGIENADEMTPNFKMLWQM